MESFTTITNMYTKSTLNGVALSALPNAPVLPYTEPRRRVRRVLGTIRHPVHRRHGEIVIDVRAARYGHQS